MAPRRRPVHLALLLALPWLLPGAGLAAADRPDPAAWGKAAGGIALGLSLSASEVGYGEDFTVTFHVKNTHTASICLIALDTTLSTKFGHRHQFLLQYRREGEDAWRSCHFHPPIGHSENVDTLEPGEVRRVAFAANAQRSLVDREYHKVTGVATWPPMPGRYVLLARLLANGRLARAREAGLWVDHAVSGEAGLVVSPFAFLEKVAENPNVSQEEVDALYHEAFTGGGAQRTVEKLVKIGDRKACLMLVRMLRDGVCPPEGIGLLAEKLGDQITFDLAHVSRAYWAQQAKAAGRALGRLGTPRALAAAEEWLESTLWSGRSGFILGLGESTTAESLALLATLATDGSAEAVAALAQRPEPKAHALLSEAMTKGKSPACAHAARVLAKRGTEAAVQWLADRWDWENAAAFLAAPIQWPTPPKGMLTREQALAVAAQALPALQKPEARYLSGKWYLVSVSGHPQVRGRFAYVVVDAASGAVITKHDLRVLR